MSLLVITPFSDVQAVGAAAVVFDTVMATGEFFMLVSSTLCWVKQGAAPVASAADTSTLVPPNTPIYIDGAIGAKLSVLQHTAGGSASLTRVKRI